MDTAVHGNAGITKLDPHKQIFANMLKLIESKRLEGFRPNVMMDANCDYLYEQDIDKDFAQFIKDAKLADHFHEKFPDPIRTYVKGSKRLW